MVDIPFRKVHLEMISEILPEAEGINGIPAWKCSINIGNATVRTRSGGSLYVQKNIHATATEVSFPLFPSNLLGGHCRILSDD
jgi:hypothetical protein